MSLYVKIILCIFALAYFISPADIIPDMLLPFIGWLDDGVVIATVFYLLRTGKLPDFLLRKKRPANPFEARSASFKEARYKRQKNGSGNQHQSNGSNTEASDGNGTKPPKPKTPHEILGLSPGATRREIQAAYKEAIKKYHPDKLSHLGEEFSTLANEKFLEIQEAYDTLMKRF